MGVSKDRFSANSAHILQVPQHFPVALHHAGFVVVNAQLFAKRPDNLLRGSQLVSGNSSEQMMFDLAAEHAEAKVGEPVRP